MMTTRVRKLISRLPLMVEITVSIQEAARLMTENVVSSVLLIEPADEEDSDGVFRGDEGGLWRLKGMVTDEDLRSQVVAAGVKTDRPVGQLSDGRLITIQSDESVNEAMLTMLRNHIQRLPVLHRRRPVGVLHLSDIVRYETNSSLYLASNIFSRNSVRDLSRLIPEIRAAFIRKDDWRRYVQYRP
jgi:CBS domain-containing protein